MKLSYAGAPENTLVLFLQEVQETVKCTWKKSQSLRHMNEAIVSEFKPRFFT